MIDTKLVITDDGHRVISNMEARVRQVSDKYGEGSKEHLEMFRSLVDALYNVLRLGGKVMADGELSLVSVSFMTYGVVFHPKYNNGEPDSILGLWVVHS